MVMRIVLLEVRSVEVVLGEGFGWWVGEVYRWEYVYGRVITIYDFLLQRCTE